MCVEQYRTAKRLHIIFLSQGLLSGISKFQKIKQRGVFLFNTPFVCVFETSFSPPGHKLLHRDVKIYIDTIGVNTAGYNL